VVGFWRDELIGKSGNVRVYKWEGKLFLEIDSALWALESELKDYKEDMANYPKGDCLEIGLGLGIASKHILSFPEVKTLTTVEINSDVIIAQKMANYIEDKRHTIINEDGFKYVQNTDKKFDFIFLDFYQLVPDLFSIVSEMIKECSRVLKPYGKIAGWINSNNPIRKEFADLFI
jgi:spermidine synthase